MRKVLFVEIIFRYLRCHRARLLIRSVSQLFKRLDMIYFVGGAPRAGKSLPGQRLCTTLKVGWVSTDLLMELLRVKKLPVANMRMSIWSAIFLNA